MQFFQRNIVRCQPFGFLQVVFLRAAFDDIFRQFAQIGNKHPQHTRNVGMQALVELPIATLCERQKVLVDGLVVNRIHSAQS